MDLNRGTIVLVAGPQGDERSRAFLIVQSNIFNASHPSFTMCPMSGAVGGEALFRVAMAPTPGTGLRTEAEVQVDKVQTLRRARIVRAIGQAPATAMEQVDQALRRWMNL